MPDSNAPAPARRSDAESPPRAPRGSDRRAQATPRFSRFTFLGGRRRAARRHGEAAHSYVDAYDARMLLAVMWIAVTNVADSFFTMIHLQGGGSEANPIADLLLMTGRASFVLLKCLLVTLALVVLCVHKNFRIARIGLWVAAGAYTALLGYHLLLFLV